MSMSESAGLQFIAPLCVTFAIDGRGVEVSPIRVGELPGVLKVLEPLLDDLMLLADDGELLARLATGEAAPADISTLLSLVARSGGLVIDAVALAARVPKPWVEGLLIDRLVELLVVALRVNADFFVRAMPGIVARLGELRQPDAAIAPTGATPSSSSSRTDTGTPTSSATRSDSYASTSSSAPGANAPNSAG